MTIYPMSWDAQIRKRFIAEASMEDDKRSDRNQARAEASRRLARIQGGVFWVWTERTLT